MPEWRDPEARRNDLTTMDAYLRAEGFNAEELSQVIDHRIYKVARKAMLYDRLQKQKPAAAKKVVAVPKVQKPGAKVEKTASDQATDRDETLKHLRSTRTPREQAKLIERLIR